MTIFIGTAGLPHILTRFFTVPDSNAARKSVLYMIGIIASFTAIVTIIGFGARALLGKGAIGSEGGPEIARTGRFRRVERPVEVPTRS